MEIELTSLLSWVKSTATPASTLPTVKETNILETGSEFRDGASKREQIRDV